MVVGSVILYHTTARHTPQDRNVQRSRLWALSHRVVRWFVNSTPIQLSDATTPTCRHTVAYSHRPRSCCHCRRCYAPLPWRCPSETKQTHLQFYPADCEYTFISKCCGFFRLCFLFWPFCLLIVGVKGFYIPWTVYRDTHTWEWPRRFTLFLINLFQLNYPLHVSNKWLFIIRSLFLYT
jgi:hypothetical protein